MSQGTEGKIFIGDLVVKMGRGAVFAALYNGARPQGMGFLQYDPTPITAANGQHYIDLQLRQRKAERAQNFYRADTLYFDYVLGRVMKVDLSEDFINPSSYDRDNGEGAVELVIRVLRETGDPTHYLIAALHENGVLAAANLAQEMLAGASESVIVESEGMVSIQLGLDDELAELLAPRILAAMERVDSDTHGQGYPSDGVGGYGEEEE